MWIPALNRPMNDIKIIEELRMYHERLKAVVTALKRLEERDKESKGQAPPQARVFNPERNELKNRLVGCRCSD